MNSSTDELVRLTGVTVRTVDRVLLADVDWSVRRGERWIVLGPNGAGKSTLLAVAAGYRHPSRGSLELLGHRHGTIDMWQLWPRLGFAGAVMADRLARHRPVIELVMAAKHGTATVHAADDYDDADEERARRCLIEAGAADLLDRDAHALSQGEWQRVQLARARMSHSDLLLLDEPTAGLDVAGREQLLATLDALAIEDGDATPVVVTNQIEDIPTTFDHALLLRDARVLAAGPIEDVLTRGGLSECFGMPLELERRRGRWTARAAG